MGDRDYNLLGKSKYANPLIILMLVQTIIFIILFIADQFIKGMQAEPSSALVNNVALSSPFINNIYKPWTLLTYGISHISIWAMISNMIWLWMFGNVLQEMTNNKHIVPVFIYGVIIAGICFILMQLIPWGNQLKGQHILLGANTGVIAIALASVRLAPDYRFFRNLGNGIPLWVLGLIFILLQAVNASAFGISTTLSYLTAAVVGSVYVTLLNRGKEPFAWMYNIYNWFIYLLSNNPTQNNKKAKVFYLQSQKNAAITKKPTITQKRIDNLLDKISAQGLDALTTEERDFLRNASK